MVPLALRCASLRFASSFGPSRPSGAGRRWSGRMQGQALVRFFRPDGRMGKARRVQSDTKGMKDVFLGLCKGHSSEWIWDDLGRIWI